MDICDWHSVPGVVLVGFVDTTTVYESSRVFLFRAVWAKVFLVFYAPRKFARVANPCRIPRKLLGFSRQTLVQTREER